MRNTEIEKEIILKGSDDKKNWYTISKNYPDRLPINTNDTSETRVLRFPQSNYAWFELSIRNHKHDLIQILQASYIDEKVFDGAFTLLPNPKIIQEEKDKKSQVYIIFNKPYNINRLQLDITGPDLYLRNCELSYLLKEGKYYSSFNSSIISSENPSVFEFQTIKTDTLLIEIENNDNPALKINKIAAYQLNVYIIANLSANENYSLCFGDQNLNEPIYDLKYFATRIPKDIKVCGLKKSENIAKMKTGKESEVPIYFNRYVLWSVISIVALVLVFLTIKVIKEMK
jgi:subtilase family serine protease